MIRLLLAALIALVGCQSKPTKITESQSREFDLVISKSEKPLKLDDNMIILDARPAFDFGLSRVVGSHHFPWENLVENAKTGELIKDRRKLSQRLSLFGLTPDKPVVVVGRGPEGQGEEGRLAWTLLYLGFQDVQTASVNMFRKNLTQMSTPVPKNEMPADLEPNIAMVTSEKDFKRLAADPKYRMENRIWIVDVRSEKEYFNKDPKVKSQPDIRALHIEWKEFFTDLGRPNSALRKRLKNLGVGEGDRIILVSQRGDRSGAAAYALIAMGFKKVENYLSGF